LGKKLTSNLEVGSMISGQTPGLNQGRQKFGDGTSRSGSTNFNVITNGEPQSAASFA
jgi:hypothetical protein